MGLDDDLDEGKSTRARVMIDGDPAVLPAARVLELLRSGAHPAVRMIARDVWPSFSGVAEVVCVTLSPEASGWLADGQVLPDQFGVRPESFTEHLDDDRAGGLIERVLATSGASLAWLTRD